MSAVEKSEHKHTVTGKVVGAQRDKTASVEVVWSTRHPRYGRVQRKVTKLHFHDANNEVSVGDFVRIVECRPISKTVNWKLVEILEKAN